MDMFQIQQHGNKFWSFSWHSPFMDKHVFQQTVEKGGSFQTMLQGQMSIFSLEKPPVAQKNPEIMYPR